MQKLNLTNNEVLISKIRRDKISIHDIMTGVESMNYRGLYTAIVTPFRDNVLDVDAFQRLIEKQVEGGVDGIVPVGTTGESPTLSNEEHLEVIRLTVQFAAGRCQVVAGTGSNSTDEAIALTQEAEKLGATGSLQVCPYYNKPSQEGVYRHYKAIAENTKLPIMLYSIPGRSGIEIAVPTVAALAKDCPNIIAIKEAGGQVDRVNRLYQALPEDFAILSGDDGLTLPFIACGAQGLVSVASNVIPAQMKQLVDVALSGDGKQALALQKQLYPLLQGLMGLDVNPVPVKAALSMMGLIGDEVRLPLAALDKGKLPELHSLLASYGLI